VDWEPVAELESCVCRLLSALMLARVDGKSPVEYLSDPQRDTVQTPREKLAELPTVICAKLEQSKV